MTYFLEIAASRTFCVRLILLGVAMFCAKESCLSAGINDGEGNCRVLLAAKEIAEPKLAGGCFDLPVRGANLRHLKQRSSRLLHISA